MVVTDPTLELLILARYELLGGEVRVVRVVLYHIVPALCWRARFGYLS